jgi:hypothetical protein
MIDEADARRRAEAFFTCPSDDPEHPWSLESFAEGWLLRRTPKPGIRGSASYVIERESGRIVGFPSSIAPRRVRDEYPDIVADGTEVRPA